MPDLLQAWKKQLQQGNTEPLAILFTKFGSSCIRSLQQKGCSLEDAEDILQDAVLIFRQNLIDSKVCQADKLNKYLYTICLNLYRIRRRQPMLEDISEVVGKAVDQNRSSIPEETVVKAMQAFRQLSSKCQQLLISYYDQGMRMDEIAEELQLANADVAKATKFRCIRCWIKHLTTLSGSNVQIEEKSKPNE